MFKLCVLHLFFWCLTLSAYGQAVFINEINYIGATTATDGFGIAGPAGTVINGWTIVFYNVDGSVSHTENLEDKTIPDQGPGYGEVWYDVAMVDEPSAFAIVNNTNEVVQFVSYGLVNGITLQVTGATGIAEGITSIATGIQATLGNSIQLIGSGTEYDDFVWFIAGGTSPGNINLLQNFTTAALPIQLVSFEVKPLKTGHELTWVTSAETNNDYFMVERSVDGVHFEDIKKIEGQNNFNQTTTYQYFNKTHHPATAFYYRLRQMDMNGAVQFSPILYSVSDHATVNIQTFPNPTTNEINISIPSNKEDSSTIHIVNIDGQLLKSINFTTTNDLMKVDVQSLPSGNYFLQIKQGQQTYSGRFVKN